MPKLKSITVQKGATVEVGQVVNYDYYIKGEKHQTSGKVVEIRERANCVKLSVISDQDGQAHSVMPYNVWL